MAKSEGAQVRAAIDGPSVEHDQFIDFSIKHNERDRKRASSAGEDRAEIKRFLDETDLNSKALSWGRQILKISDKDNGQAKAMDVIRSLEKVLPMVKAHVGGQSTAEMDFGGDDAEPTADVGTGDLDQFTPDDDDGIEGPDDDSEDFSEDFSDEFDDAVDALADDSGKVVAFQ